MGEDDFGLSSNKPIRQSPGVLEPGRVWSRKEQILVLCVCVKDLGSRKTNPKSDLDAHKLYTSPQYQIFPRLL